MLLGLKMEAAPLWETLMEKAQRSLIQVFLHSCRIVFVSIGVELGLDFSWLDFTRSLAHCKHSKHIVAFAGISLNLNIFLYTSSGWQSVIGNSDTIPHPSSSMCRLLKLFPSTSGPSPSAQIISIFSLKSLFIRTSIQYQQELDTSCRGC